jgi:outer membrane protein assembly factor BamB
MSHKSHRPAVPLLAIGALLVACGGGGSGTVSLPLELGAAVAYQLDAAHSGFSSTVSPNFPAAPSWQRTFIGNASSSFQPSVSYPLIAGGKVFVLTSAGSPGGGNGTQLYALDVETGAIAWGPIDLGANAQSPGHAYDQGKIFVVNLDGLLQSFDASTGAPGWRTALPSQRLFTAPPTATGGKVYVIGAGSGTTVYAVDEVTGSVIWQVPGTADAGSPTIGPDGLFIASPCQTYGFALASGAQTWHADLGCIGGGGRTDLAPENRIPC